MVHGHATRDEAMAALITVWDRARVEQPNWMQLVLAFLRRDVAALNARARACLREAGAVGAEVTLPTASGPVAFATGDRLAFGRNDPRLGVRNGSLGTVEAIHGRTVTVRLDGDPARRVSFSLDACGRTVRPACSPSMPAAVGRALGSARPAAAGARGSWPGSPCDDGQTRSTLD